MAAPAYELEDDTIPRGGSAAYTLKEYWDSRFEKEEHHEWLAGWSDIKALVNELLPDRTARILLVGCGNSSLAADMAEDGYTAIVSTDYSEPVIERMRTRVGDKGGRITWSVADMTDLRAAGFDDASFDAVFDKAAMDAILADGGDTWSPPEHLLAVTDRVMRESARVLRPGGRYLQVSFGQPHFRKQYLLNEPAPWTGFVKRDVPVGFGYFLYSMVRAGAAEASAAAPAAAVGGAGSS